MLKIRLIYDIPLWNYRCALRFDSIAVYKTQFLLVFRKDPKFVATTAQVNQPKHSGHFLHSSAQKHRWDSQSQLETEHLISFREMTGTEKAVLGGKQFLFETQHPQLAYTPPAHHKQAFICSPWKPQVQAQISNQCRFLWREISFGNGKRNLEPEPGLPHTLVIVPQHTLEPVHPRNFSWCLGKIQNL